MRADVSTSRRRVESTCRHLIISPIYINLLLEASFLGTDGGHSNTVGTLTAAE